MADILTGREETSPSAQRTDTPVVSTAINIGTLVERVQYHAKGYFWKGGRPTSEVASIRSALRYLLDVYPDLSADAFGVSDLRAVRDRMVEADLSRGVCNQNIGRIVRTFRWAASV